MKTLLFIETLHMRDNIVIAITYAHYIDTPLTHKIRRYIAVICYEAAIEYHLLLLLNITHIFHVCRWVCVGVGCGWWCVSVFLFFLLFPFSFSFLFFRVCIKR